MLPDPGEWHTIVAEKKAMSLHLTVDGKEVWEPTICPAGAGPSSNAGQAFVNQPTGRIYNASYKQVAGCEIHGEVRNMQVS